MYRDNNNSSSIEKFYDANQGFKLGNIQKSLYDQYKNYTPKEIKPSNKKNALLLFILKCDFAINDLMLYLDVNSESSEIIELLNYYKDEYNKAVEQYKKDYGPLLPFQTYNRYTWNDCPFPWE